MVTELQDTELLSRMASGDLIAIEAKYHLKCLTSLRNSYTIREPEDCLWGLEASGGNWTGIVGTLQYEKADFSMDLTLTPQRAAIVEYGRVYIGEEMAILSLKPRPLPEYLALFRPLEGTVWVSMVAGVMVWSLTLWALLRIIQTGAEKHPMKLTRALFYGWGLLLEDTPYDPPDSLMLGVWLLVCLVLRTSYTSSLTSHLVVQGESSAINDMETLVRLHGEEGRQWGTQIFSGAFNIFLSSGSNPVYHTMKTHMQVSHAKLEITIM
ncbi:glutamate receptor U1-like [Eriocheir sinensis]|uniref:glutamate receptor U1-like n=1 Tax=Eriocheir sinensis TaxID=95602 RepID=UPI0021C803A2|nr:glutamate receptor U1-like [Eriocheir sinensis]